MAILLVLAGCRATDAVRVIDEGPVTVIEDGRVRVRLEIEGDLDAAARAPIVRWVEDGMRAIKAFYGRFPVDALHIQIAVAPGEGISDGVTRVWNGTPVIRIGIGDRTRPATFARDWVLTHEMVHTAFPDVPVQHHWLEEGIATYVEPIARARAGLESDADVWLQLVEGLPKGQPRRNDRGLDRTPTWGRTYWGGALFCLVADVRIREHTDNRFGLRDALVVLVDAGWNGQQHSTLEAVLARMDAAVGVPVLSELYAQHATNAVRVDLDDLWRKLGIVYRSGRVTFDDSAPHAALRRAITH